LRVSLWRSCARLQHHPSPSSLYKFPLAGLPHTARAALTGLRHRGYDVRLERGETGRASVYRAIATLAASA